MLALEELHRRRPEVEIALFGESRPVQTPFPHRDLGVLERRRLAHAYASAAVGLVLSLTNPSLVPAEMLACGLPVVDVRERVDARLLRRGRSDHAGRTAPARDLRGDRARCSTTIRRRAREALARIGGASWSSPARHLEHGGRSRKGCEEAVSETAPLALRRRARFSRRARKPEDADSRNEEKKIWMPTITSVAARIASRSSDSAPKPLCAHFDDDHGPDSDADQTTAPPSIRPCSSLKRARMRSNHGSFSPMKYVP